MIIAMIAMAIRMNVTSVDGFCWSGHDCFVGRAFIGLGMILLLFISMRIYII